MCDDDIHQGLVHDPSVSRRTFGLMGVAAAGLATSARAQAKVVEKVGELYKLVRMSTMLMLDAVEKTTELSERQRQIIKDQAEGMLEDLHKRVTQHFATQEEENERQEAQDDEDV